MLLEWKRIRRSVLLVNNSTVQNSKKKSLTCVNRWSQGSATVVAAKDYHDRVKVFSFSEFHTLLENIDRTVIVLEIIRI